MIYISIISHGHERIIDEFECVDKLAKIENVCIIIKDNKANGYLAKKYAFNDSVIVLDDNAGIGFGANNNHVFNYCKSVLGASDDDYFLIMNPDVNIDVKNFLELKKQVDFNHYPFVTINLFKNISTHEYDFCVRKFPTVIDFFNSFFFGKNNTVIDKNKIIKNTFVDWGAGSFLMIRMSHYFEVKGFDEHYFMYCEDIDLCYRYTKHYGNSLLFIPSIIALHDFRKDSKKILSKHFFWHVKSMVYYLFRRYFYNYKVKSRIR